MLRNAVTDCPLKFANTSCQSLGQKTLLLTLSRQPRIRNVIKSHPGPLESVTSHLDLKQNDVQPQYQTVQDPDTLPMRVTSWPTTLTCLRLSPQASTARRPRAPHLRGTQRCCPLWLWSLLRRTPSSLMQRTQECPKSRGTSSATSLRAPP